MRGTRDYSQAKIYEIVCNLTGDRYIGSTCKKYLSHRLNGHVGHFKMWKNNRRSFMTSFPIIERGNYKIVLIEKYPCQDINELRQREAYWIKIKKCLNKHIPKRTKKQWAKDTHENIKERQHKWYEANKELTKQRARTSYQNNMEHNKEVKREYYFKNKEKIQASNKQKITCECGAEVCRAYYNTHIKNSKHIKLMNDKKQSQE